jgi:hypothetical protein
MLIVCLALVLSTYKAMPQGKAGLYTAYALAT